jgi:hypothetical protein
MGINYNPRGVSEGLIYYIDPNNVKSFSGTGNTVYNLVNASIGGTFVGSTAAPIDSTSTRTFYMGGSNYINCPNNIPLTNNFTVSAWFKLNTYNTGSIIGKWYADNSNAHRCWIMNSDVPTSSMAVVLSSDGTYTNSTIKRYLVPVSLNEYTNITFTFASGTLLVYKNGLLFNATKAIDGTFSMVFDAPTRPFQVGYFFDFSSYYNLANVGITQIYNRVLSPTEILQNFDAVEKRYYPEENIVRDGLILNLDPGNSRSYAGAGNTIYDLAGFGNTGTLSGGLSFSALNGGSISNDAGNKVLSYQSANFSTNNFTMEAWVSVRNYPGVNAVFISNRGGFDNGWLLDVSSNKKGRIYIQRDAGTSYSIETTNELGLSKWTNLLVVRNGTNLSLYRDGIFQNSTNLPSNYDIQSAYANDYVTRNFSSSGALDGNISTIKYYNRALSAQEIQQNYNATKNRFINVLPPVRDNLILNLDAGDLASYPGSGTTWFDLSGNSLNGTLTNGPTFSFSDSSSSIVFDGTNDYASTTNTLFPDTGPFTVGLLYKITGTLGRGGIFERYEGGNFNGVSLGQGAPPGTDSWQFTVASNLNTGLILSYTYPSTNVWYHDVGVYNGSNEIKIYRNGVLVNSLVGTTQGNLSSGGARSFLVASRNLTSFLPCHINNITVYNRALSAAEILQNFNFYRTRYGI